MTPHRDFARVLREQQERIRRDWAVLRRLYPGCFDAQGKPLVAELRLPGAKP